MGVYRDSRLGLCIDIRGPDGNVFYLLGIGDDIAQQLGRTEEWKEAINAVKAMGGNYMTMVNMFRDFFPVVTLVGYEEIVDVYKSVDEVLEEDS